MLKLNDRVKCLTMKWSGNGTIIDYKAPITMNGTVIYQARYKVNCDEHSESVWLRERELELIEDKES